MKMTDITLENEKRARKNHPVVGSIEHFDYDDPDLSIHINLPVSVDWRYPDVGMVLSPV